MTKQMRFITAAVLLTQLLTACGAPSAGVPTNAPSATPRTFMPSVTATPAPVANMPNPASENCVAQGGTVSIQKNTDGSEYGLCVFPDGKQCEEWAMLRGECPVGGLAATPVPAAIQPLPAEVCHGQAQAMAQALNVGAVTQSNEPLFDPVTGKRGTGCQATITGTGEQFQGPVSVVQALGAMLIGQGFAEDMLLAADGPTGTAVGYRKADQMCLAAAMWQPDASANCPKDQPIAACELTPAQKVYTISLNCGVETP